MIPPPKSKKPSSIQLILRRLLFPAACFATIIAIFYTEENLRAKRAWEQSKREAGAKGMAYGWEAFVPPPIPDEQNVFKAPRMTEWFVRDTNRAAQARMAGGSSPSVRNPLLANSSDQRWQLAETHADITNASDSSKYLTASESFKADFDLIRDALKRPGARMDGDYQNAFSAPTQNFLALRTVAQVLAQRAHCHLILKESEKAMDELTFLNDLRRMLGSGKGVKSKPIIAVMISAAIVGLHNQIAAEGFKGNLWHGPELLALQRQLDEVRLLEDLDDALQFEQAAAARFGETKKQSELAALFIGGRGETGKGFDYWMVRLMPRGWILQNLVTERRMVQETFSGVLDAENQIVRPGDSAAGQRQFNQKMSRFSPFNYLTSLVVPNYWKACQTAAKRQTFANEAKIACALERYRIDRQEYPESLDSLTPKFMEKIPRDIIGGAPLQYHRQANGRFLLYSIGWNEKDDQGVPLLRKDGSEDGESGDWIWSQE